MEREYLREDIRRCAYCNKYIEDKSYMFINKYYFHRNCFIFNKENILKYFK